MSINVSKKHKLFMKNRFKVPKSTIRAFGSLKDAYMALNLGSRRRKADKNKENWTENIIFLDLYVLNFKAYGLSNFYC